MVKRVLVIRFSALGDVAMLLSVLRVAAEAHPEVAFTLLSRQAFAPLAELMPENVHFQGADLKGRHKGIQGLEKLLQDIDYRQFDAVADIHNVQRSVYLRMRLRLAGKRIAILKKGRSEKWRLTHHGSRQIQPLRSTVERYAEVFESLGIRILPLNDRLLANSTTDRKGIGIAPFAAHQGKIYPPARMEEVVRRLSQEHIPVYLFGGGPKETAVLQEWAKNYEGVECMAGKGNLADDIRRMSRLSLMVSMDSGNMHLASLAGTRVVSIWGATHPYAGFLGFGQSESDCIQRDLPCRPCSVYGKKACRYGDYRCMDIPAEEVAERILTAYKQAQQA